ncbi:MAG: GNAT family N-acetyltransferase [Candidatus Dormiibacterota bacterium]
MDGRGSSAFLETARHGGSLEGLHGLAANAAEESCEGRMDLWERSAGDAARCCANMPGEMERIGPASVVIRRLGADDAELYRAFRIRAVRETPTAFTSSLAEEIARPLAATAERLAAPGRPNDAVFGAFTAGGDLVGVVGLRTVTGEQERHKARLFGMAVSSDHSGRGIGTALVQHLLIYARGVDGLVQVDLRFTEGNRTAERLYRSCGFVEWGREPDAVRVDGHAITKVHMTCALYR